MLFPLGVVLRYSDPGKFKPFSLRCLNMALLFEKADMNFHRN